MNYIYDIYLNFTNILIDFFEWNKNDKLTHLKKVPIIKVNKNTLNLFCFNKIKVDIDLLNKINYKTEIWKERKNIKYCCLFCSDSNIICIKFDKNGISFKKSFLFIDEELEILDTVKNLKEKNIKFKILDREKIVFKTRYQEKKCLYIKKNLSNIDNEKLKYIYYECFNKYNNKEKMILDMKNINENSIQFENLYNILKLISSIKK